MVEVVEGYPERPHGFCCNPKCESYGWATDYIETSSNDLDEDETLEEKTEMNNNCEIGTIGKYTVTMSLADLKEIANGELRAYSEELEHDNSELQHKLDMAIEALKFYAADENYHMHGTYGNTNVRNDNGKIAKEALKEIEK